MSDYIKAAGCILLAIALVVGGVNVYTVYCESAEIIIVHVTDKEKDVYTDEDGTTYTYYVYTAYEIFEVTDNKIFGDPDIYNQLRVGKTYEVGVIGWQVRWMLHRNINLIYREIREK